MDSGNNESWWVGKLEKRYKIEAVDSDAVEISPDGRYLRVNSR